MRSFAVIPVVLGFLFLIGCGGEERTEDVQAINQKTETIAVETIQCQMCVAYVQQAAAGVQGVDGININFDTKIATVSFNADYTSLSEIEKAIAKAGYHANETKRDEEAYVNLPDCCR